MVKTLPGTGLPASVLTIKYFVVGYMTLEHYNFHISNLLVTTKMHIVHIQCLVEGSILAGVFLTSSFCVVPQSSYSSNAAVSSLLVAWSSTVLLQLVAQSQWWLHSKTSIEAAAETGSCSAPAHFMWTTIGFTEKLSPDFFPTELTYM